MRLETASHSVTAIADAEAALEQRIASSSLKNIVVSVGISPPDAALNVFVNPAASDEEVNKLRDMSSLQLRVEKREPFVPTDCSSAADCDEPRQAGVRITRGGSRCTTGPVVHINGEEYVTTAAHCWADETSGTVESGGEFFGNLLSRVSFLRDSTPESDSRALGTLDATTNDDFYDGQDILQAHSYGAISGSTVVCLHATAETPDPNCGEVHSWNHELDYACCPTFYLGIAVDDVDCPGGSSGGIYTSVAGPTAVGIQSGRESSVGSRCAFSHVDYIENDLGVEISTTPNP